MSHLENPTAFFCVFPARNLHVLGGFPTTFGGFLVDFPVIKKGPFTDRGFPSCKPAFIDYFPIDSSIIDD